MISELQGYIRYLAAKRSVDDRALNRRIWDQMAKAIVDRQSGRPIRVVEAGSGIGTMLERLADCGVLFRASYRLLDIDGRLLEESRRRLAEWALSRGFTWNSEPGGWQRIMGPGVELSISFEQMDVHQMLPHSDAPAQDLVIAHALLDIVNARRVLRVFSTLLRPGGLMYLTLTYDGETAFLPEIDGELDRLILDHYHQSMDERMISGKREYHSRTGRTLFYHLAAAGAEVLAAGSSDWIVFPHRGIYPSQESDFLNFILETVYQELKGRPGLDTRRLEGWVSRRQAQIQEGNLIYMAKQLDVLAQVPGSE